MNTFSDSSSFSGIHPNFHYDMLLLPTTVDYVVMRRFHQLARIMTYYKSSDECRSMTTDFGLDFIWIFWPSRYVYCIITRSDVAIHKCYDVDDRNTVTPDCYVKRRNVIHINTIVDDPLFRKYFEI